MRRSLRLLTSVYVAASPASGAAGLSLCAWMAPAPNLGSTCRFYGHSMFAPKSTHFYTHVEPECRALRNARQWTYEVEAFAVRLLERALERRCPAGAVPLYRLCNNGQEGAPNHRCTTDLAVFDAMIPQGWTPEGDESRGFFACVT